MRDDMCPDCRKWTAGDCGQHGAPINSCSICLALSAEVARLTAERDRATERVGELSMGATDHDECLALLQAWARECGISDSTHQLVGRLRENRASLDEKRCDRIKALCDELAEERAGRPLLAKLRDEYNTVLAERDGLQAIATQRGRELARLREEKTADAVLTAIGGIFPESGKGWRWGCDKTTCIGLQLDEARRRVRAVLGAEAPEVRK